MSYFITIQCALHIQHLLCPSRKTWAYIITWILLLGIFWDISTISLSVFFLMSQLCLYMPIHSLKGIWLTFFSLSLELAKLANDKTCQFSFLKKKTGQEFEMLS